MTTDEPLASLIDTSVVKAALDYEQLRVQLDAVAGKGPAAVIIEQAAEIARLKTSLAESLAAGVPIVIDPRKDKRREVLDMIIADSEADVTRFEGMPFTGKTVAEYMGCQAAMIQSLAKIVKTFIPDDKPLIFEMGDDRA
jgi:hypothetical protein